MVAVFEVIITEYQLTDSTGASLGGVGQLTLPIALTAMAEGVVECESKLEISHALDARADDRLAYLDIDVFVLGTVTWNRYEVALEVVGTFPLEGTV